MKPLSASFRKSTFYPGTDRSSSYLCSSDHGRLLSRQVGFDCRGHRRENIRFVDGNNPSTPARVVPTGHLENTEVVYKSQPRHFSRGTAQDAPSFFPYRRAPDRASEVWCHEGPFLTAHPNRRFTSEGRPEGLPTDFFDGVLEPPIFRRSTSKGAGSSQEV